MKRSGSIRKAPGLSPIAPRPMRSSAIADYEQALRIEPRFDEAAGNLAAARRERDRRTALNSDNLLPSFDCRSAALAVEKAICSDPDLSRLDREIDAAYKAALASRNCGRINATSLLCATSHSAIRNTICVAKWNCGSLRCAA